MKLKLKLRWVKIVMGVLSIAPIVLIVLAQVTGQPLCLLGAVASCIAFLGAYWAWWRCPICGLHLGKGEPKCCPRCGKELEDLY